MKVLHCEGREPVHTELEALEKLYEYVLKRKEYLSHKCYDYLKLLEGIDKKCVDVITDIKKEEFVHEIE